jgi:hypothetical protein
MKTKDGRLVVVGGASRSGKSAYVTQQVKNAPRVTAYDPEAQWCELSGWLKVTTRAQLLKALQSPNNFKVAYVAGGDLKEEFNFWAGCVMYAGRYIAPLDAVAEELADVTNPSKAPLNWGLLVRRGLKRGINIFAISQRWSEADKTSVGNASEFVLFRQSSADDVRYLSRKTRIDENALNSLLQFEYIKYDAVNGNLLKEKLRF